MKALFVPTADAARLAHAEGLADASTTWVTFNLGARAYCDAHRIACDDLNSYITPQELWSNYHEALPRFTRALLALDTENSAALNCFEALPPVHWFFCLFRYFGLREYAGILLLDRALRRHFTATATTDLELYGCFSSGLAVLRDADYRRLVASICEDEGVLLSERVPANLRTVLHGLHGRALYSRLRSRAGKARNLFRRLRTEFVNRQSRTIEGCTLLFEPLYEVAFLPMGGQPVYRWSGDTIPVGMPRSSLGASRQPGLRLSVKPALEEDAHGYLTPYLESLASDLRRRLPALDGALHAAKWIVDTHNVTQALWGSPPATLDPKALIVEYLRTRQIPVFGVQHGGSYGDQPMDSIHLLSDYLYCDYFLSYAQNVPQFDEIPDLGLKPATIVPVGSMKAWADKRRTERSRLATPRADILFPVTALHDISLGAALNPGALLLSYQRRLLRILEGLDATVVVKPMKNISLQPHYADRHFPIQYEIDNLSRCIVDESRSFEEALGKYRPRMVVLEYFSTPLQECLGHDVEILQLIEPVGRPKAHVRELLAKRVHIADNIDELEVLIGRFMSGQLPRLRNAEFFEQNLCPCPDPVTSVSRHLGWANHGVQSSCN